MAGTSQGDIGYYTLPVILSFDGIEKKVSSQLSKAFGDVGKKSSKAMADATEQDVARAAKAYGALRDKAQDALGKVRVEEEKLAKARASGKQDQIVAAEERLNKARRDSSRLVRESKDAYDDLSRAQTRVGSSTGRFRDGLQSLSSKISGISGTTGAAVAGLASLTGGMIAGAAAAAGITVGIAALPAGLIAATRALYGLGDSWDRVTDAIAVKTGKLGPDLDKLKNAVKEIAPSTASSIDQIGSVIGSVSQALRVSGMDLDKVSKTILDLNRLTGEDLNVRELGKAFRGFGVDAKGQVPTLDALYRASAATGISVNDMVAAVVQAGPAARTMGLDLSQTAALLGTFNEAGINGEAALKGLSLAAKNLAKDGRDPAIGLRETITELDGLLRAGRDVDAVNLAAKIFGKGYQPLLDAIRSGALDAQSLNDALATGGVTIEDLARSTADWSERWQQFKNTLSVALEPLATGVFDIINTKLTALADWVTNNQSKVIGFFQKLVDWSFRAAESVVRFTADALRTLAEMVKGFSEGLADLGGVIKYIPGMGKLGEALEKIDDATNGVPAQLNKAADAMERNLIPALEKGRDYTNAYIERTKQATRFTEVLGDSVATVNDNGDIVLSDNTPEVEKKLNDLGITVTKLPDGTFKVEAATEDAATALDAFRAQQAKEPIELPTKADTKPAGKDIEDFVKSITAAPVEIPVNAGPFNPGGILGPGVPGNGPQKFATSGRTGSEAGLNANSIAAKRAVESAFPAIKSIGGYRPPDGYNEHFRGEAIDVMIPNWGSPQGKAYGDRVAQYLLSNASALGIDYVLWQQRQWNADGTSSPMGQRPGGATANHFDHVHAHTVNTPDLPGGKAMKFTGSGGMQRFGPDAGGMSLPGATAAGSLSSPDLAGVIDTSRLYSDPAQAMSNSYGTPGYKDGQAGYYQPDPKKVREATQRVDDANESIRQADAAVAQAQASLDELDYTASESQRLSATESLRSAKYRRDKAIRDRDDAVADLAETQRGDFTKAKAARSGRGGSSDSALGGLGSIASSFLKDTFGLDLSNFMPLQMLNTVMGFAGPLIGEAAAGTLGMQTPGWYPGMSAEDFASLRQGGTSVGPFGIPNIDAPPMPEGNRHSGAGGAPGPATIVNVNNSQNFTNSSLGWDPVQVNKERENNIWRAPRLPIGMGG